MNMDRLKNRSCYNIAHRGARSLAPENTMPAFIQAWQVGAHGIETDVSVSTDEELILFHDETFSRTTNVADIYPDRRKKPLHSFTWDEIQHLDAGTWFIQTDPFGTIADGSLSEDRLDAYRQTPVPLLAELLSFVKEKDMFLNIEIKPLPQPISSFGVVEHVLSRVEEARLSAGSFSISSFHHPFLHEIARLRPDIEVNALIGGNFGKPQVWGNFEFAIYNANVKKIDIVQLEQAKKKGCGVNLYTVNRLSEMVHYLEVGVDKIITDYPQLLSEYFNDITE